MATERIISAASASDEEDRINFSLRPTRLIDEGRSFVVARRMMMISRRQTRNPGSVVHG